MEMKLELVLLPVSDVDRAKAFYVDVVGFREDVDVRPADGVRVVQLTPPGSACSIGFGTGLAAYDEAIDLLVGGLPPTAAPVPGFAHHWILRFQHAPCTVDAPTITDSGSDVVPGRSGVS
jgi:catechol 2,3-dioxygenase-like lactoylglutathione lyase family enzyme